MRLKLLRRRNIGQPTTDRSRSSSVRNLCLRKTNPEQKLAKMADDQDLSLGSIFPVRGPFGPAWTLQ